MSPADYDAWYETPRGLWIGEVELRLLRACLEPREGAHLLDVGCGSGYFTRALARSGLVMTGLDPDEGMIRYARAHAGPGECYLTGDARSLPFPDESFDDTVAITSFCFVADAVSALRELVRVTRRRVAVGLLNRYSLLHWRKAGHGAYHGAHWHAAGEVRRLFTQCGMPHVMLRYAVFLPRGGMVARWLEPHVPARLPVGGFLLVVAEVPGAMTRIKTRTVVPR